MKGLNHLQVTGYIRTCQDTCCRWEEDGQDWKEIMFHAFAVSIVRIKIFLEQLGYKSQINEKINSIPINYDFL